MNKVDITIRGPRRQNDLCAMLYSQVFSCINCKSFYYMGLCRKTRWNVYIPLLGLQWIQDYIKGVR